MSCHTIRHHKSSDRCPGFGSSYYLIFVGLRNNRKPDLRNRAQQSLPFLPTTVPQDFSWNRPHAWNTLPPSHKKKPFFSGQDSAADQACCTQRRAGRGSAPDQMYGARGESFTYALLQGDSCNFGLLGMLPNSLTSWRWRRGPAGFKKETWLEGFWGVCVRV